MKLRLIGMVLGVMFVATNANAGLLIDPYVGMGSTKTTLDVANADDETGSSTVFGSRLGWSFLLLSAGIDYQMMNWEDDDGDDVKLSTTSAFVGFDLPILLRFWGEYMLSSNVDTELTSGTEINFDNGYAIGVGFTGLPLVSLNLEVEALNYTLESGTSEFDYTVASTVFSVSFPINL